MNEIYKEQVIFYIKEYNFVNSGSPCQCAWCSSIRGLSLEKYVEKANINYNQKIKLEDVEKLMILL